MPATRIRELRLALMERYPGAFRAAAVAQRIGVSESALTRWERGLAQPTRRHARALARELGVTVDELQLEPSPPMETSQPDGLQGNQHTD